MSLHVDLFCTRVCVYGSLRVCKEVFARGCKALHTHLRVHGRAKVCKKIVARGCGNLHSWVCSGGSVCSVQRAACKAVCAHGGVSVSKGGQSTQSSLHMGVERGIGTHTWMGVWALCTSVCKHNGSVSVQGDVCMDGFAHV